MSAITTIQETDVISTSRTTINTNFANLNSDKIEISYLDTDTSLTANSDSKIATQKAVKTYIDIVGAVSPATTTTKGSVEIATDAEVIAGTNTGGTGASLTLTPGQLGLVSKCDVQVFTTEATIRGDNTTNITVSNTSGNTWRYTYNSGTNPNINSTNFPVGNIVNITGEQIGVTNQGIFKITNSGTNYFEVLNYSGQSNTNTIGYGRFAVSNSTWTKPTNAKIVEVIAFGGGGSGGYASYTPGGVAVSSGGGGSSRNRIILSASALSSTEKVLVAPTAIANSGNSTMGFDSSFGTYLNAYGGGAGSFGNTSNVGGSGAGTISSGKIGNSSATSTLGGLPATTAGIIGIGNAGAGAGGSNGLCAEFGGASAGGYTGIGGSSMYAGGAGGSGGYQQYNTVHNSPGFSGGRSGSYVIGNGGTAGLGNGVGGHGGNGTSRSGTGFGGDGGGGGGNGNQITTGNGGHGGVPGGGGGGAGSWYGTGTTGVTGNGARGEVIVITYF